MDEGPGGGAEVIRCWTSVKPIRFLRATVRKWNSITNTVMNHKVCEIKEFYTRSPWLTDGE